MNDLPPVYSQRDPRWGDHQLGFLGGDSTLHNYGCYVTCFAMVASYFGRPHTPATMNALLKEKRLFVQGNLVTDGTLEAAIPACVYGLSISYADGPADLDRLARILEQPENAVILEVDFNPSQVGVQTHFVLAVSSFPADGRVTITDPWTGTVRNLADGYGDARTAIQKFVWYRGEPAHPLDEPFTSPPPQEDDVACQEALAAMTADRDFNYQLKMQFEATLRDLEAKKRVKRGTTDKLIASVGH
jgi:hypothetical protein